MTTHEVFNVELGNVQVLDEDRRIWSGRLYLRRRGLPEWIIRAASAIGTGMKLGVLGPDPGADVLTADLDADAGTVDLTCRCAMNDAGYLAWFQVTQLGQRTIALHVDGHTARTSIVSLTLPLTAKGTDATTRHADHR